VSAADDLFYDDDGEPGTGALYHSSAPGHPGSGRGRRRAAGGTPGLRRLLPLAVGGAAVLVLLIGFVALRSLSGDRVEVPLLTNLSKSDAETMLREAGLTSTYLDPVTSPTVPAGHIAEQDPHDGSRVGKGAVVTLRLSSGPATIRVPDLANLTQDQATARLAEVNLVLGGLGNQASNTIPVGHVIATDPAVNTALKPKDRVRLIVSSGPDTRQMPSDIIGKSYDAAKAELEGFGIAGLTVQSSVAETSDAAPGSVVGTDPHVGQPIQPNSAVTLTVAAAPAGSGDGSGDGSGGGDGSGVQVIVPKLVGKAYHDAESLLRQRGLNIDRVNIFGGPNDRVIAQSAQPGSKIEKGSTVHVNTVWQWGN
jgi:serine/threonine-protein kinase